MRSLPTFVRCTCCTVCFANARNELVRAVPSSPEDSDDEWKRCSPCYRYRN